MDDLISRAEAIKALNRKKIYRTIDSDRYVISDCINTIVNLPSAQRTGKWIRKGEEGDSRFMCSICKCKEYVPTIMGDPDVWKYCPNCGARMDGDRE